MCSKPIDELRCEEKVLGSAGKAMFPAGLQQLLLQLPCTIFPELSKVGLLKSVLKMKLNHNKKNTSLGPLRLHTMWLTGVLSNHFGEAVLNVF